MADKVELLDGGILHITVMGDQMGDDVKYASAESDKLLRENNIKKIRYLVDFSAAGRIDPSARQALRDRLKTSRAAARSSTRSSDCPEHSPISSAFTSGRFTPNPNTVSSKRRSKHLHG